jgi:hypothetical protein
MGPPPRRSCTYPVSKILFTVDSWLAETTMSSKTVSQLPIQHGRSRNCLRASCRTRVWSTLMTIYLAFLVQVGTSLAYPTSSSSSLPPSSIVLRNLSVFLLHYLAGTLDCNANTLILDAIMVMCVACPGSS